MQKTCANLAWNQTPNSVSRVEIPEVPEEKGEEANDSIIGIPPVDLYMNPTRKEGYQKHQSTKQELLFF